MGIGRIIVASALVASAAAVYVSMRPLVEISSQDVEYEARYRQALIQCADRNSDGFISRIEQDSFDARLFEGRGVVMTGRMPRYEDGTTVPVPLLIRWLEDYRTKF